LIRLPTGWPASESHAMSRPLPRKNQVGSLRTLRLVRCV